MTQEENNKRPSISSEQKDVAERLRQAGLRSGAEPSTLFEKKGSNNFVCVFFIFCISLIFSFFLTKTGFLDSFEFIRTGFSDLDKILLDNQFSFFKEESKNLNLYVLIAVRGVFIFLLSSLLPIVSFLILNFIGSKRIAPFILAWGVIVTFSFLFCLTLKFIFSDFFEIS